MLSTRRLARKGRRDVPWLILILIVLGLGISGQAYDCEAAGPSSVTEADSSEHRGGTSSSWFDFKRRQMVCGDGHFRRQRQTLAINSTGFELDPDGTSHITWPFLQDNWWIFVGSVFHVGDDIYADDWNWGSYDDDEGKIALAPARGHVIFAGRNPLGQPFDGYGNQVVVEVLNEDLSPSGFAYRYAHLKTIAVSVGDYVHFGSEIGTVGGTGENDATYSPHLHSVLYKNIYQTSGSARSGIENLSLGFSPSATLNGGATIFAAAVQNDAFPYFQSEEDLPCTTWNGDKDACNAHSILFGGQYTQDCAYYYCSTLCLPRGTSNCQAECEDSCNYDDADDSDESIPCHTWNGNKDACNEHSILFGDEYTRDCAYYTTNDKCRPRGTSNCLAGILGYCAL